MLMLGSKMMEGQLLAGFLETLRGLPEAQAKLSGVLPPDGPDREYDARVDLRVGGKAATLLIEVKKALYPRDVRQALWQFQALARQWPQSTEGRQAVSFLVAESISPGAKDLLRDERVGYYDSGGSLFLPAGKYLRLRGQSRLRSALSKSIRSLFLRSSCASAARSPDAAWRVVRSQADCGAARGSRPATASQVLTELEKFDWVVSRGQGPSQGTPIARAWRLAGCMGQANSGDAALLQCGVTLCPRCVGRG